MAKDLLEAKIGDVLQVEYSCEAPSNPDAWLEAVKGSEECTAEAPSDPDMIERKELPVGCNEFPEEPEAPPSAKKEVAKNILTKLADHRWIWEEAAERALCTFVTAWRIFKAYSTMAAEGTSILFLGSVGLNGSLAALVLVAAAVVAHPANVFYISGAYETPMKTKKSWFPEAFTTGGRDKEVCIAVDAFFASLPLFAFIDERLLAMHGGPCPALTAKDIREGFDPTGDMKTYLRLGTIFSEPAYSISKYSDMSPAVPGYLFGPQAIEETLEKLGANFIIRAHQKMMTGASFYGDWLISLCSAWAGDEGDPIAMGAVLRYDGEASFTMVHFIPKGIFHPTQRHFERAVNAALVAENPFPGVYQGSQLRC
ncbi:unnamed protein product, partial [Mesorhabditis spiculigera]